MSTNDRGDPRSFREQVAEQHAVAQRLVSLAAFAGYGVGCAKAHVRPKLERLKAKLAELTPEAAKIVGHAYRHAVELGLEEESLRRAERAAARALRHAAKAARSAWQGMTG